MQPAEFRDRDDSTHRGRLDIASHRRIAAERHVGPVGVVVRDVLSKDPTRVVLAEHDDVVNDLPSRSAHPSFGEPVLPRGPRSDAELRQTKVVDATVEGGTKDLVAVAD
jgi:hypothetical protein